METLVHAGLSNALAATILAVLVASVAHFCRRPALVHSFWLLVLLRLLMPPFFAVGIPWPNLAATPSTQGIALALASDPASLAPEHTAEDLPIVPSNQPFRGPEQVRAASGSRAPILSPLAFWKHALFSVWLAGSIVWLVLACWRLYRFGKLLRYAGPATSSQQEQVRRLAAQLG